VAMARRKSVLGNPVFDRLRRLIFFHVFSYVFLILMYIVCIHTCYMYIDYKILEKNRCTFLNASHIHGWCAWERVRGNWN